MNRPHQYILNGKKPVPCDNPIAWSKWFDSADRHVAQTQVGEKLVSTVFLGLDHQFCWKPDAPPILFETMIFVAGGNECGCWRDTTWDEAEARHWAIVALVQIDQAKQTD